MSWDIEFTNEFDSWWDTLDVDKQERIRSAVEILEEDGPGLGRPLVDSLKGSRHAHMKELRPPGGHLRSCSPSTRGARPSCCWAATRRASGRRSTSAIPEADHLYDEHLAQLRQEGEIP